VRNPWDMLVSAFWFKHCKKDFSILSKTKINELFVKFLKKNLGLNHQFYFKNKILIADIHLRFERLQDDFDKFSNLLKIPQVNLPRLKSQHRKDKRHYSTYYQNQSIKLVANCYKDIINHFGYKFSNIK
jgi:hypothetical protein